MSTIYRIISDAENRILWRVNTAYDVAVYMLGLNIDNYIIVKIDDIGQRVVKFTSPMFDKMVESCENA